MRTKLDQVPLEIRRRAARHLEGIRGSSAAPRSKRAALGEAACPIYRLDLEEVAFWEIEIEGIRTAARDPERKGNDRGFIVLSTGRHDLPIPHWSVELEPPSRTLEAQAENRISRIVKADALAYVAEGEKGEYLSHVGQMPLRPTGLPKAPPRELVPSSFEAGPAQPSETDKEVEPLKPKRTGVRAPRPKLVKWDSWGQLRKGFASAYRPYLKALAAQAEEAWQVEDLVAKFGEGIHEGEKRVVPLLSRGKASLSGDGADLVKMRMLEQGPAVELTAGRSDERAEQSFDLDLSYDDGSSETLSFFVVPKGTPSKHRGVLPHPEPLPPQP